ncbi:MULTISPECIES: arylsulfatase [Bradyrhizobium]|uniref:arylsulfatase n=1 Tax=Bradyrhizobium TaxID=374 RepID=UPI000231D00F|nr:arylsulfatase [Bradyrhizobium japonicum]AJA63352.1 arylsulfatase [Bradyrhizobium japonicum]KMJ98894.1 arylsulfatase [Bradyrhizobium japonicum]MBR0765791.1 arylsulfatase [Bradyrhizobium japonicum]MCS3540008.1 arylsulfatase [Bradyrhizobium japonicum]MCS3992789.1 arylsulfatase [Bradyrhizobium japonicum]
MSSDFENKNNQSGAQKKIDRRNLLLGTSSIVAAAALTSEALAQAQKATPAPAASPAGGSRKPNILFIMGDDIGWFNVSAYNMGVMGYRTPNIDRIGKEGAVFTDWYGQQSCTAGRAAFITGQSPIRTGLTKVGLPGAELGLGPLDPSVADVLKTYGYATGQFGKNHLGDRDEHLPTAHGFDEFFGNLYHLNAEEEPENPDYPKDPEFRKKFGPRGVLKATSDGKIENTGPLTSKRMETVDEEFLAGAKDFINRQHRANRPWFCYFNSTRMHIFTHLKKESEGKTGLGVYPDGMVEHDGHVGELLKLVDDLGVADNTIVVYTTDNGAEVFTWPDGGATPFKGEKATNWEGGFRVPCLIRWPGVIKPGTIVNDICSHEDFIPTFAAANGDGALVENLKKGSTLNGKSFKVHLDGMNLLPFLKGDAPKSPREEFLYWSDDGDLMALRIKDWKVVFMEQHTEVNPKTPLGVWQGNFTKLRGPNLYNLRADPFERGPDSIAYGDWQAHRAFMFVPAQAIVARYIESFKDFPPRAKAASFTVSDVMEKITAAGPNKN